MKVSFMYMKSVAFPVALFVIAAVFLIVLSITLFAVPVEAKGYNYYNHNSYNQQLYWCGTYYSYSPCASYNYSYQNYSPYYYNSYPYTYTYPQQQQQQMYWCLPTGQAGGSYYSYSPCYSYNQYSYYPNYQYVYGNYPYTYGYNGGYWY